MTIGVHGAIGINGIVDAFSARSVPILSCKLGLPGDIIQMEVVIDSIKKGAGCTIVLIEGNPIVFIILRHLLFDAFKDALLRVVDPFLGLLFSCEEGVIVEAVAVDVYVDGCLL